MLERLPQDRTRLKFEHRLRTTRFPIPLIIVCACVCVWKNTENPEETERTACGVVWCVCVVWCCEVRKCEKKSQKQRKNDQNTDSFLGTTLPSTDPKTVPKRSFFPTHCFLHIPWDFSTFLARGPIPNAQTIRFSARGPIPKVLIMRRKRSQPAKHPVLLLACPVCADHIFCCRSQIASTQRC